MSKTIDERVVSMQFDNRHFETNVRTTMSTLDKLKRSLNLSGASKGLDNVSAAAKKCDLAPVSNAVENVKMRFSALEVMAVTALANITNSAVNAGKRIVKALTLDPITTGFSEYETKINAIQTIMSNTASKGTTMADVTRVIDELNTYADKTIYNFAEMTRNIGTFTAAGVGLEESAAAIQGIANLAAASGSSSQQASTAMYQLSQALAAGTVKLMDWNSVVNAGMGGEKFQIALKETARELGTNVDELIEKNGSFRDSLSEGWITAEVLNTTLKKFTKEGAAQYAEAMVKSGKYTEEQAAALIKEAEAMEDAATKVKTFTQLWDTLKESVQSGWGKTWELVIGNFEDARVYLTELSDLLTGPNGFFTKGGEARNQLLDDALSSNWAKLTQKINEAGVETDEFESKLRSALDAGGYNVDELIKKHGSLANVIRSDSKYTSILRETIEGLNKTVDTTSEKLFSLTKVKDGLKFGSVGDDVKQVQTALKSLGYDLSQFGIDGKIGKETTAAIKAFQEASGLLADGVVNSETIAALEKASVVTKELSEDNVVLIDNYEDLLKTINQKSGRELLLGSLKNALVGLITVLDTVRSAWHDIFAIKPEQLYKALDAIHSFSEKLVMSEETADKLQRTLKGLFAVLDIITTIAGGAAKIALQTVGRLLGMLDTDILGVTARIGDSIVAFRDWIDEHNFVAKGLEHLIKGFVATIKIIRDWIQMFLEIPAVQRVIADIETEFNKALSSLNGYFTEGIERIKDFANMLKSMDSLTLDDLSKAMTYFKEHVFDYFFNIDDLYNKFVDAFENIRTSISKNLKAVGEKVIWLKDKFAALVEYVSSKIPAAIAIGVGVMLIRAVGKIADVMEILASPLVLLEDIGDAITRLSKAHAFKTTSQGVMNLAISIGILAASLTVLTLINQDNLWSAVGALSVLTIVLTGLALAIAAIEKFGDFGKSSASLVMLSGSLLIIANCLKTMAGLDVDKAWQNVKILGALAIGLAAIAGILGTLVPKLSSGSITFLAIAGALKVMVDSLVELDSADFNHLGKSMTLMLGLIGSLALIAKACGNITFGSAVGIIAIAVGLKILIGVIEDIGDLNTSKLSSNIEAFVAIFAAFSILMISSKFAGANAAKAGIGILAISAAILLIVQAMKNLGELDSNTLSKATGAVSQLLIVFAAIVALSHFAGANAIKAGIMLLAMSGAMLILSGVIHILKDIEPGPLWKAVGAITVLEILFGGLIAVTKIAQKCIGTIIVLSVVVAALAGVVALLSLMDPAELAIATGALAGIMAAFALLVSVLRFVNTNKGAWKSTTATLATMLIVVGGLAAIIVALSKCEVGSTIEVAASLSLLLMSLAAACAILGAAAPVMKQGLVAAGVMTLIVAALAGILGVLASFNPGPTLEIAASLSILLLSLSACCVILAAAGAGGPAAFIGIGALATLIVAIGGLMVAIGALAEHYPGMEKFLDTGIVMLEKIGTGIGSFVGGIVGGVLGSMTSGLPIIGRNLSEFMDAIQPFLDGAGNIDPAAADGAKTLAKTILILTAADVLDALTSKITGGGSFVKFGAELAAFGPYMKKYADSMTGVDTSVIQSSANAAEALAALAKNLPSTGGKWQEWFGSKNLETFGSQLITFGTAIAEYSKSITANGGLDIDAITASAEAASGLADITANLPSTGGKWQEWFGGKNLETFGSQLIAFGTAIAEYSESITANGGIDADAIAASAKAAKGLGNIAANLPSTGGKWQEWFGGKDLAAFGDQLCSFGEALTDYSKSISGENALDVAAINTSVTATKALAKLADNLPSYHVLDGKSSPTEFGQEIVAFGESLSEYSTSITGIDLTTMSSSITQTNRLVNMMKGMTGIDSTSASVFATNLRILGQNGVSEFIKAFDNSHSKASTAVTSFVKAAATGIANSTANFISAGQAAITSLITGMRSRGAAVPTAVANIISSTLTRINSSRGMFTSAGTGVMTSFSVGIQAGTVSASNALVMVVTTLLNRVKAKTMEFNTTAQSLMTSFVGGVRSKSSTVSQAFASSVSAGLSSMRNYYQSFYNAGVYLVDGFAAGITAETWYAEARARAMANKAYQAAMDELDSHSPSRLFMKVGSYVAQGFAIGIRDNTPSSTAAASDMAVATVDTVRSAISRIADVINGGIDTQPTIRPILDLSNVESGTRKLQAVFSRKHALSVRSDMERTANSGMSEESGDYKTGSTFQFTQINNSPKALSRHEIYRQTSNQFSTFERMVKA